MAAEVTSRWQRQRASTKERHRKLIVALGAKCVEPGCDVTDVDKLEVDHKYGTVLKLRDLSWSARIALYWREAQHGMVQAKCRSHNAVYRPTRRQEIEDEAYERWRARADRMQARA